MRIRLRQGFLSIFFDLAVYQRETRSCQRFSTRSTCLSLSSQGGCSYRRNSNSPYGTLRINGSEPAWGVTCMHGPNECAGNVQQLCAEMYTPSEWWNFVQCMK